MTVSHCQPAALLSFTRRIIMLSLSYLHTAQLSSAAGMETGGPGSEEDRENNKEGKG